MKPAHLVSLSVILLLATGQIRAAEPEIRVPANGVSVPMLEVGGRPAVHVRINGKGPFLFLVDTGADHTVVEPSLANELSLSPAGEQSIIQQLEIGDATLRDLAVHAGPLLQMRGPGEAPRGVLSALSFPGYRLTFDFVRKQITIRPGALGEPDGKTIFSYSEADGFPTVPVRVAGKDVLVHLDTGAPMSLALPTKYKDQIPLEGPLEEGRKARTPSGEFPISKGTLKDEIEIGTYKLPGREIFFCDAVPHPGATPQGQLGSAALRDFAVTLDSRNRRIEFARESAPR